MATLLNGHTYYQEDYPSFLMMSVSMMIQVLHCLALKTMGHPLWDAETRHEALWNEKCILHRDTSPGNIFPGWLIGCTKGWEGFVADLEFAWVAPPKTETIVLLDQLTPVAGQQNIRGIFCEETVMLSSRASGAEITVGVYLESFILVLFYAVIKCALECGFSDQNADNASSIKKLYCSLFGGHTISEIIAGWSDFLQNKPICLYSVLDTAMHQLLHGCWKLLKSQRADGVPGDAYADEIDDKLQLIGEKPQFITYNQLYTTYDVVLNTLSKLAH
ncbi:hypothetical protein BDR05DRAFT_950676 [Suillus weaverae]|nr:hypothetical protein BDR05DRAFT_950676 [Suillus weaverae]